MMRPGTAHRIVGDAMKSFPSVAAGILVLAAAWSAPASAVSLLADYRGYDYEPSHPGPGFGDVGNTYEVVATVPQLGAPLTFNFGLNEYTCVLTGLTSVSKLALGTFDIIDYSGGTLNVYCDLLLGGTAATYGTNPPNATAPSSFIDGTTILVGTLSNFQLVFDNATQTGSFEGDLTIVGGTQLGNFPVNQRAGWTFAGVTGNSPITPIGYHHQVDGSVYLDNPVPVQATTWSGIKSQYTSR